MSYVPWAVGALIAYTFVPPLTRVATTGTDAIPSDVAAVITNIILVLSAVVVVVGTDQRVTPHLGSSKLPYAVSAGVFLAVGILAYYRALAAGPVSIVTPIFGMFLVTSSVFGMAFLGEDVTARKLAGIGFAVVAIYLVTVE